MRAGKPLIGVTLIAAICILPGSILRWKIGQSVAAKMPELIGPAQSYSADVTGGFIGILRGRIEKIDITGRKVKMSNGVIVDRLDIALSGVHFKPDQTVTRVESASFAASVIEDDLNNWLATSRPDLHDGHIAIENGKIIVRAKPRVLLLRTPVKVEGTLRIIENNKLYLVLKTVSTRGIRVPGFVRGRIEHDINPILDAEQMGIGAKLKSVNVTNHAITITGTADVNKALAKA